MTGMHVRESRRICLVTETYSPEVNGVALTLRRLVDGLRARGHSASVVCPRQPCAARADREGEHGVIRLGGVALPGYRTVRAGLPAGRVLRDRWIAQRPDAVYVATEGPLGWSAVGAARRLGVPVWSGFHTDFSEYARRYGIGFLAPLIEAYLRGLHNRTRGTLAASPALQAELVGRGFQNVRVLGRGVDAERFAPCHRSAVLRAGWGVGDEDLVAIYVGRLAAEKNVPLAIEAFRAMRQAQPSVRLVIVGDGPLRESLETDNRDVTFCGTRTGAELATHYASADVFLFPSETETFGNVTLEAMASGLIVLAYDYAAAGMHIVHGESGVLIPRGDAPGFVEQAAVLARSPERLLEMRRAARDRVVAVGWNRVVDRFERLLTGTVDSDASIRTRDIAAGGVLASRRQPWRSGIR